MQLSKSIINQKKYFARFLLVWGVATAFLFIIGTPVRNGQVDLLGMILVGAVMGSIIFAAQKITNRWVNAAKVDTDTE